MAVFDEKKLKKIEFKDKKHTIMIVDDEKAHLSSMESMLSEDYQIITACDGQEALDMIKNMECPENISLIISDLRMPRFTGIKLFEELLHILPKTIRIILTGYVDIPVIIEAINKTQIYQFIQKPFEPEDLKLRVKRAVEAFERQQELDIHRRTLEKKNKELVQKIKELDAANKELIALSLTDPLTGLRNVRYLNEVIEQDISIVQMDYMKSPGNGSKQIFPGNNFIFFILEIDEFKQISETYRHQDLDRLLQDFSDILQNFFSDSDIIIRRGDAEFLIVNRFAEKDKVLLNAKNLLRKVEEHTFLLGKEKKNI